MSVAFTDEACNALKAIHHKESYGCEKLQAEIEALYKDIRVLSRQALEAMEADIDLESRDAPIYDRNSTISRLDRAATELALTQGEVQAHTSVFDSTVSTVQKASAELRAWEREYGKKDDEDEDEATPDDAPPPPVVPPITMLYKELLKDRVGEPSKQSRKTILKKSQELKQHKQTLLWQLMPEIDLGDSDKWWISLGSLVSKHVGGELEKTPLDPEPNGYNLSEDDSDDELFVSRKTNLKCPIAGDYLENPVRAIRCGHLYSGNAFKEWLRNNQGRSQCPVAGCTNNLRAAHDVKPDEEVIARVKGLKRKEEKKQRAKETLGTQRI